MREKKKKIKSSFLLFSHAIPDYKVKNEANFTIKYHQSLQEKTRWNINLKYYVDYIGKNIKIPIRTLWPEEYVKE